MSLIALAALHAGWLGMGLATLDLIRPGARPVLRRLLEAYVTGLAINVVVLYLWAACAPVQIAVPRVLTLLGLGFGLAWIVRHRHAIGKPAGRRFRLRIVDVLLVVVVIPPILLVVVASWSAPLYHWDPLAIWATKAGHLLHGEFLRSEAFVDPLRVHAHRGYPIGYAVVLLEHGSLTGSNDQLMMSRGLAVMLIVALAFVATIIAEWSGRRMALAAIGLLVWTPVVFRPEIGGSLASGYADLPLGLCAAIAAGLLVLGLAQGDQRSAAAGAAALTLALTFKNEGMLWVVLICGLAVTAAARQARSLPRTTWLILLTPLIVMVALRIAHLQLPSSSDLWVPSGKEALAAVSLGPRVSIFVAEQLLANPSWGLLRIFLPAGLAIGLWRSRREPLAVVGLCGPLYLAAVVAVCGLTGVQLGGLDAFAVATLPRLVLQLIPSCVLFAVILNSSRFSEPKASAAINPAGNPPPGR